MNQMECVCINGHEHSLGDTALVFPLLPCFLLLTTPYALLHNFFSCFEVHNCPSVCSSSLRSKLWTFGLHDRSREKRLDLPLFIGTCRAVLSSMPPSSSCTCTEPQSFFLELWMRAACSGGTGYLSAWGLLLVSSAFSQGVHFSFSFFRMPCPLKIFSVLALCSLLRSTRESPFSCSLL